MMKCPECGKETLRQPYGEERAIADLVCYNCDAKLLVADHKWQVVCSCGIWLPAKKHNLGCAKRG